MKYLITLLFLFFYSQLEAQQSFDATTERRYLLKGVSELPKLGAPGPLGLTSANAFPVILAPKGDRGVLVGAGSVGNGRAIGFGHDGYVGKEGAQSPQVCALMNNAVRWVAKRKASPAILVKASEEWANYFATQQFQVKKVAWNETITQEMLQSVDVVFLNPERLDANNGEVQTIKEAVQAGKGIIVGGLGWGWKYQNPNKNLRKEQKANILLADAGIEWLDGTLAGERFPTQVDLPTLLDYEKAKQYVLDNDFKTANRTEYAMAFSTLMNNLPRHGNEPFAIEADFPANAPEGSPKVVKKVTIDTKNPYWNCTGLYAQAGEPITIQASNIKDGVFKIRIGAHTDKLYEVKTEWLRHPEISVVYDLKAGKNELFNPFGGLIYVEVPQNYAGENLLLQISGAVEAPYFKLGKTNLEQWKNTIRNAPAPWGEIEGNDFAFTVESEYLRNIDNPDKIAQFWDKIQAANKALVDWDAKKPHKMRLVFDKQISMGYMHSGYPIMALTGKDFVDEQANIINLEDTKKWGFVHELGHNHQEPAWTFEGTVEVTCNLFSMYALETVMNAKNEQAIETLRNAALKKLWNDYVKGGKSFEMWKKEPFIALIMYKQLVETYGWDVLKNIFKKYHQLPESSLPKNDQQKCDLWLKMYSEEVGENLSEFFDAWNVPVSAQAKNNLNHLPKVDVKKLMGDD